MKTQRLIKLAFLTLFTMFIFQSCSKEDVSITDPQQPSWTVRPDFALLDDRPQEVIARFRVTDSDTKPVELTGIKGAGQKFALVIGISDYAGTQNDLRYCDEDANDWKNQLVKEGYDVTILQDSKATKAEIENAVNYLASQSVEGAEIALCYSGHGSRGNIVSSDLYYISSRWFKTKFANSASSKMMFCFDACQIGAMTTDLNSPGRVIAVASSKSSYSYDGNASMKNGVFTYYQMIGFNDLNYIYLEPDCQYACDQMINWAKTYRIRVVPSFLDSFPGDFDL